MSKRKFFSDSVIAGKFAGETALAAVGASYPITMIFMAVAVGCQIGCSVAISKRFGSGEMTKVKTRISTAVIAGLALSAAMTILGVIFSAPMMKLVNTPENIFPEGNLYLKIYTDGFFLFLYNVVTGIFNSLGDSKTPPYLLIFSSVIAGYSASIKLNTCAVTVFTTLWNGVSSFTAQNMGANKTQRIKSGLKSGMIFVLITAAFFSIMFLLFNNFLLSMFMKNDISELAYKTGGMFLKIVTPFYFVICELICDSILRGSGYMNFFMAATFTDLILRVVLAFIFSKPWKQNGIWTAWPISWFIAAIMSIYFCKMCLNRICRTDKHCGVPVSGVTRLS